MKTIELNTTTTIVLSLIIAGLGSVLPSFFNLAGYISAIVYIVVAFAIGKVYINKMWYRIHNRE